MSIFYKTITDWLLPLGYEEIYKNNQNVKEVEYHFAKNGIRVQCYSSPESSYCKLSANLFRGKEPMELTTMKHPIHTEKLDILYYQLFTIKNFKI